MILLDWDSQCTTGIVHLLITTYMNEKDLQVQEHVMQGLLNFKFTLVKKKRNTKESIKSEIKKNEDGQGEDWDRVQETKMEIFKFYLGLTCNASYVTQFL